MKHALGRRAAIAWSRERELSPQRLWPALRESGGVEELLSASDDELIRRIGSAARARAVRRGAEDGRADRWAAEIERSGVRLLTPFDEEYPRVLAEIADPPLVLFAIGDLDRLKAPA